MKRRLVILTEIIAPYRVPVFNALAQRDEVGRQEVHRIHEKNPEENHECGRRHELVAVAMKDALRLVVDEIEAEFDERLLLRRDAARRAARDPPEEPDPDDPGDRPDDERIHVERHEVALPDLLGEEGEVVTDVLRGILIRGGHRRSLLLLGPTALGLDPRGVHPSGARKVATQCQAHVTL